MELTVKELRNLLFNVSAQDMTIRDFRKMLFDVENQDQKLTDQFNTFLKMEGDFIQANEANEKMLKA